MIQMKPAFAGITLLALLSSAAFAQSAVNPPAGTPPPFQLADVHASAHSLNPYARSTFRGDRYIMRQENMVDLIANAYSVDPNNVFGGPSWLETDRFDIYAKTPPKTSPAAVKLMLRALLADRFKLVVHTDSKPLLAYVLSLGKGAPKMTEAADPSADPACKYIDPPPNPPAGSVPLYTFSCHNTTMEAFAQDLHDWAGDYMSNPVVDSTGLKGAWDFEIKFHSKGRAARAGADGITIFDAVDKQLGLKLEARTSPLPVVAVDSVDEKPTPNLPGLEKELPPPPPVEFEVATIRPSPPDEKMNATIDGNQVILHAGTMEFMLTFAYDVTDEMVVGAPKWVTSDRFDLLAKPPVDPIPGAPQIDRQELQLMVQKFLAERFQLAVHREDRPLDAYTLMATANPKLKKADPANRTGCKEGPGADGKDPRIANPILGRLLTCRNMTLPQFAAELQTQANGYIHTAVLDATGIEGAYDITLSFSSAGQLPNSGNAPPTGDPNAPTASDPSGAVSLPDAINKQLGLKLVKQKRPVPALVIDHIEEKPTDN
jgi:uncharacterized protein (TIGR03435 family)